MRPGGRGRPARDHTGRRSPRLPGARPHGRDRSAGCSAIRTRGPESLATDRMGGRAGRHACGSSGRGLATP